MRQPFAILATVVMSLGSTACAEDITGDDLFGTGTMTATIDGQPWSATTIIAVRTIGAATVSGTDASGVTVRVFFEPGTSNSYVVEENTPHDLDVQDGTETWSASGTGGTGTITITTLSGARGVGVFEFTGVLVSGSGPPPSRVVTGGAFDVRW